MKDACPEHVDWLHALGHEYSCLRCIDHYPLLWFKALPLLLGTAHGE